MYMSLCTELLSELARREKQAGIYPEADVDLFMKVGYTSFTCALNFNCIHFETR